MKKIIREIAWTIVGALGLVIFYNFVSWIGRIFGPRPASSIYSDFGIGLMFLLLLALFAGVSYCFGTIFREAFIVLKRKFKNG